MTTGQFPQRRKTSGVNLSLRREVSKARKDEARFEREKLAQTASERRRKNPPALVVPKRQPALKTRSAKVGKK